MFDKQLSRSLCFNFMFTVCSAYVTKQFVTGEKKQVANVADVWFTGVSSLPTIKWR